MKPPSGAAAFTLVEMLVVLAIIGIAAGVVSLSVQPSEQRLVVEEGERLAVLFRLAQDEARVSGRPVSWQADTQGYRFFAGDILRGNTPDDPLRPREWPFHVQRVEAPALVFGAEPLLPPAEIRIATSTRELVLVLDAFGVLSIKP
jgi:general secretion pathway protein H